VSQGNSSIDVSVWQPRTGAEQRLEIQSLIRDGYSFSARERNCCFLNTGSGRFTDVSRISGLDFPDDGRAAAHVDWDQDGDLDLWVSNRNGPQVRFLRNDVPAGHHFLAVRLVGRESNRDAIGARLELVLQGDSSPTMIKTLRAGEGFLAQSSKWVHFGMGSATEVDRLTVRWPGGSAETFRGLAADRRYRIVQGSGQAELWKETKRRVIVRPSPLAAPPSDDAGRLYLASRVPLPRLDYESFEGQTLFATPAAGRSVMVNLWATWCPPCLTELRELAQRHQELVAAGLDVIAVSVDGASKKPIADPEAAARLAQALNLPFATGRATVSLLDKLQIVHDQVFDRHSPLPLPTSVLIDTDGQLAAIYKGPVEVNRLLADVEQLRLEGEPSRQASLVFPGRWASQTARISLVPIFRELLRYGYREDAAALVANYPDRFPPQIVSANLLAADGNRLLGEGDLEKAQDRFEHALRIDPDHSEAHVKMGVVVERQGRNAEAEAHYRAALRADPQSAAAQFALGLLLKTRRRGAEAVGHFREAARLQPDHAATFYHLADLLTNDEAPEVRNPAEAIQWAEKAAQATEHAQPEALEVLAAAYAAAGRLEEAIATAQRALELARSRNNGALVRRIEVSLEQYQKMKAA
jgi:tetratricopeptide (TPR) repeat protein